MHLHMQRLSAGPECSPRAFSVPRVPVNRPAPQPTETAERWTSAFDKPRTSYPAGFEGSPLTDTRPTS